MKRELCGNQPTQSLGAGSLFGCLSDDEGQDLIEYALLAGVLSVGSILSVLALSNGVVPLLNGVVAALQLAG